MDQSQEQKSPEKIWAGPVQGAVPTPSQPNPNMEVAAEPAPHLQYVPAGGLPPATTYPYPEQEQALVIAVFDNEAAADDCAQDLGRRGLDAAVRMLAYPSAKQEAGAQAGGQAGTQTGAEAGTQVGEQVPARRLGGRVTLGATIGATAGLFASTFVLPEAATGVPTMLTTLLGAGLGSYMGRQAAGAEQQQQQQAGAGAGGDKAAQLRRDGVVVIARVDADEADAVQDRIMRWNPVEVRVQ